MEKIAKFEKVSYRKFEEEMFIFGYDMEIIEKLYSDIELPKRATTGSAGYDFYMPFAAVLKPGESIKVPTGIRAKINPGWVLNIYPRSGLGFKYRLQLDNTVGIIDSDYYNSDNEGQIFCKVTNDTKGDSVVILKKGMAFCQGVFLQYGITIDDDAKDIRNGGMGSTTK